MRLPTGPFETIFDIFLKNVEFAFLGCLSFEGRSCVLPIKASLVQCKLIELVEIRDPEDAFPDHSVEIFRKVEQNRQTLAGLTSTPHETHCQLLATEDDLIDVIGAFADKSGGVSTAILDMTSFPKRFFCFFVKRLLLDTQFKNVIVTYTEAGKNGYHSGHLAEDPMTCDHLPGYGAPLPPKGSTLVVSVGFESLSIKPLMEIYGGDKKATKIVLAFPPNGENTRRQWNTLRQMVTDSQEIRGNLEVISAWDSEQLYKTLVRWSQDSNGLTLAPFGVKPHSLGMALFAIKHDAGVYYTQPKSYNPEYTVGSGMSWAYVVKWQGVPCFDRR